MKIKEQITKFFLIPLSISITLYHFYLFISIAKGKELDIPKFYNPYKIKFQEELKRFKETKKTPFAINSIYRMWRWREWIDFEEFFTAFEKLSTLEGIHPLTKAHLNYHLGMLKIAKGKIEDGKNEFDRIGLVKNWKIIGPFPYKYEEKNGENNKNICENDNKKEKIQEINFLLPNGISPIGTLLWPSFNISFCAKTYLYNPKDQWIVLRFGAAGFIKIWIDDIKVFSGFDLKKPMLDQEGVPLYLPKGYHRIAINSGSEQRQSGIFLRITNLKGKPIEDVHNVTEEEYYKKKQKDNRIVLKETPSYYIPAPATYFINTLKNKKEAQKITDIIFILKIAEKDEKLFTNLLNSADTLMALAEYEKDGYKKAEYYYKILREQPQNIEGMYGLANYFLERQQLTSAQSIIERIIELRPDYLPVLVLKSRLLIENQVYSIAGQILNDILMSEGKLLVVLRNLCILEQHRGTINEAIEAYNKILNIEYDNLDNHYWLFEFNKYVRNMKKAIDHLKESINLRPDLASNYLMAANYLENIGRYDEAEGFYIKGLQILPDNPEILESYGYYLNRRERKEQAIKYFRESLDIKPQNPELRDYLSYISPRKDSPSEKFLTNVEEVIENNKNKNQNSVILNDEKIVQLFHSGLSSSYYLKVIKIGEDIKKGKNEKNFYIRYNPMKQKVEILKSFVLHPDGRRENVFEERDVSLSDAGYSLYYDLRAIIISFEDLKKGDIIVLQYRISDFGRNLIPDYFGEIHFFQETIPKLKVRYVLIKPRDKEIYYKLINPLGIKLDFEVNTQVQGDLEILSWQLKNLPEIKEESAMPGKSEVSVYLHLSTFKKWNDVISFYQNLINDQWKASDLVKKKVLEITEKEPGEFGKIQSLYRFVSREIRYVGLQFGIHSFKPYTANQIFERKFGDCKDQSLLLGVMLEEIGVKSNLALLRTRSLGKVEEFPPSLEIFDHAILYLPDYDLYLDPTEVFSGSFDLPPEDQGANVLNITDITDALSSTPSFPSSFNVLNGNYIFDLHENGGAELKGKIEYIGLLNLNFRKIFESEEKRREELWKQLAEIFPKIQIKDADFINLRDVELPCKIEFSADISGFVKKSEEKVFNFIIFPFYKEIQLLFPPEKEREYDVIIKYPFEIRSEVQYSIPLNFEISNLPSSIRLKTDFGWFEMVVRYAKPQILVGVKFAITRDRIKKDEYEIFRRFILNTLNGMKRDVVIKFKDEK